MASLGPKEFLKHTPPHPDILRKQSPFLRKKIKGKVKEFLGTSLPSVAVEDYDFLLGKSSLPPSLASLSQVLSQNYLGREERIRELSLSAREEMKEREALWNIWKKQYLKDYGKHRRDWETAFDHWYRQEAILQGAFGEASVGWDLLEGLEEEDFDIIQKLSQQWENDQEIQKLVQWIGKHGQSNKRKRRDDKSPHLPFPGRDEILGLEYSGDLGAAIQSSFLFLAEPELEDRFFLEFLGKRLISHRYGIYRSPWNFNESEKNSGPMILCFDTSGSMRGAPELVAKRLTFGMVRYARSQMRECYLINFSHETKELLVSKLPENLDQLLLFLKHSFHGGTNLSFALERSLKVLGKDDFSTADVLVISDFATPKLRANVVEKIKEAQSIGHRFYYLGINNRKLKDRVNAFDRGWIYSPMGEAQGELRDFTG